MQTAVGVFGGEGYKDGIDVPPLMEENAGESHHPAISSLNCPPFVAVELCREHLVCPWTSKKLTTSLYLQLNVVLLIFLYSVASIVCLVYDEYI